MIGLFVHCCREVVLGSDVDHRSQDDVGQREREAGPQALRQEKGTQS